MRWAVMRFFASPSDQSPVGGNCLSGTPLLLCAIEWPEARIAVFVNIGLLVVLLLASRLGLPLQPAR